MDRRLTTPADLISDGLAAQLRAVFATYGTRAKIRDRLGIDYKTMARYADRNAPPKARDLYRMLEILNIVGFEPAVAIYLIADRKDAAEGLAILTKTSRLPLNEALGAAMRSHIGA